MATQAQVGLHTHLYRFNEGTSDWDQIVEIESISWNGPSRNVVEVGNLDTEDEYINKLQGMLNANQVTFTVRYIRDQYMTMKSEMETRGNVLYAVRLPNGEGLEFEGFITELPMDIGTDAPIQGSVTIEIDGIADFVSDLGIGES